ncbi:unnamed protein product [Durusdinium trenchii]|uniref:SCP domain-containing protein n=1 Tax=Durusdinium trenchii TaxID=1381693 RepID=A0ABP0MA66_9DINO
MTTTQAGSGTQLESVGAGHCSSGQIYSSSAWELGRTSVGVKGFDTPEYEAWVQEAWAKCVAKDAGAKYVSVWTDAGYRCYTATACDPNGASSTRSWESVQVGNAMQLESVGEGSCSSGQIYSSSAWELGRTSVGVKGFDTPEYEAATLNV